MFGIYPLAPCDNHCNSVQCVRYVYCEYNYILYETLHLAKSVRGIPYQTKQYIYHTTVNDDPSGVSIQCSSLCGAVGGGWSLKITVGGLEFWQGPNDVGAVLVYWGNEVLGGETGGMRCWEGRLGE